MDIEIPPDHPRRLSLEIRHRLIEGHRSNLVATAGLLAHGRGEAFDYLIGERTTDAAEKAARAAVAALILADRPVISVNGNACALVPDDLVALSKTLGIPLEINLFYYSREREDAIRKRLVAAGADRVLGTSERPLTNIPELSSNRRRVDRDGIASADVVLVPLEDGDRTEALRRLGKMVISIDLNPMSRTARSSNITIVDNIVRALPLMVRLAQSMKDLGREELRAVLDGFDNTQNLRESLDHMLEYIKNYPFELPIHERPGKRTTEAIS
ncbi:MAG: phosphopantothenate/pantothenate synthetase [Candidatus Thorarchaeota archaeon]